MKRLEYISRALSKIQHKKYELYVISRIIHRLDNPKIKYVFQQYATRNENTGKYALIDLYLPQLRIAIEVDEAHHKEQYTEDQLRQNEIEQLEIEVKRVACYGQSIEDVNKQIDKLVDVIQNEINELGCKFQQWEGLNGYEYYTQKGYFEIDDETELSSPTEICNCFGFVNPAERGARKLDIDGGNTIIWWPSENYELQDGSWINKNSHWYNRLSKDGKTIVEYNIDLGTDEEKMKSSCEDEISKNRKRVVFYKKRNMLKDNLYQFVGVFELNVDETRKKKQRVYTRIADTIEIPNQYNEEDIEKDLNNLQEIPQSPQKRYNAYQKIKQNFTNLRESLQRQSEAIKTMKADMQKHIDNNTYVKYLEEFETKLTDLKKSKKCNSASQKDIDNHNNSKLSPENIIKQEFLLKIRCIEGYNKIHCEIENFKNKYQ